MATQAERRKELEELRKRRRKNILDNASLRLEKLKGHSKQAQDFPQNDQTSSDELIMCSNSGNQDTLVSDVCDKKDHVGDPVQLAEGASIKSVVNQTNAFNAHDEKINEIGQAKPEACISLTEITSITASNKIRIVAIVALAVAISFSSNLLGAFESYIISFAMLELCLLIYIYAYNIMSDQRAVETPTSLTLILQTIKHFKPSLAVIAEPVLLIAWVLGCVLMDLCVFLFCIFVLAAALTLFE